MSSVRTTFLANLCADVSLACLPFLNSSGGLLVVAPLVAGRKADHVLRVTEYIATGLDKKIADPDGGANIERKRARLEAGGLGESTGHPNLERRPTVRPPDDSWIKSLRQLPSVSFATIYHHFMERSMKVVIGLERDSEESRHRTRFQFLPDLAICLCRLVSSGIAEVEHILGKVQRAHFRVSAHREMLGDRCLS